MVQNPGSTGPSQGETQGGSVEEGVLPFFQVCGAVLNFLSSPAFQVCHHLLALLLQLGHGDFFVDKLTCLYQTENQIQWYERLPLQESVPLLRPFCLKPFRFFLSLFFICSYN